MRHLIILLLAVGLSRFSWASCGEIIDELKAMKAAQNSVHGSLISNHELFASTLETYSESMGQVSGRNQKILAINLQKSADSFRERGVKAQKTAIKLSDATDDLIKRVSKCIK